jgi:hypothetical protein
MDILGHMLDDPKHEIEGLYLPKRGCVGDQTFADEATLYHKSSRSNLNKVRTVFELFCLAFGAKFNWGKSAAIWANKEKTVGMGTRSWAEMDPQGTRGSMFRHPNMQLPTEANFEKLMLTLKGKMITWGKCNLSFISRILVANQILLSSMWYLVACWNCNLKMCNQIRGMVRNFIWGGKASDTWAKVKWDFLTLPLSSGGLRIINPKAQSETLLAKLLMKGLALGGEPLEKDSKAPSKSSPYPRAWQKAKHPGHKLALCRPQVQTNEMFILEEHFWLLA